MLRFNLTVDGADDAARAAGQVAEAVRQSPRPVVAEIASQWAQEVFPSVFDRGGDPPWEPLSPVSLKLRGRSRPLEGEGILRDSFEILGISDGAAEVGTEIGLIHQTGGRTSPDSMIPGKEIPARPFLVLSDSAISEALGRISDFYFGRIQ